LGESEPLIETARRLVLRANFESDAEDPGFDRRGGQPVHQLRTEPLPPVLWGDRQQIQMRHIVAEMHDGESRDMPFAPRDDHRGFSTGDEMLDSRRRPRPGQSLLDQVARHLGNFARITRTGQTQVRQFRHQRLRYRSVAETSSCVLPGSKAE
jgi:hypothetical protein